MNGPARIQMTSLTILVSLPSLSCGESKPVPSLCNAKAIPLKWTFGNDLCCVPVWVGGIESEFPGPLPWIAFVMRQDLFNMLLNVWLRSK